MVAGVHGRAAHLGSPAQPAVAAGLAAGLVLVLDVTDLADGGLRADVDASQLSAGHPDDGVIAFLGEQLRGRAGASYELAASAQRELQVVDGGADRDVLQRYGVADPHWRVGPGLDGIADLQAERGEYVALLAVLVVDERDAGAAVGVVLDGRDLALDAVLVALEVDLPVELAIATALVSGRDPALVVPAGVRGQRLEQSLLGLFGGDVVEARDRHESATRAGWLELSNWHQMEPNKPSIF